jgi:lysophospholipase L1-like esterase
MKPRSGRNLIYGITAALLSLVLALLIVEIAIRVAWKDYPRGIQAAQNPIYARNPDPHVEFQLANGKSGYNSFTHFRINSLGYRGPEYKSDAGALKIAIVGDSFVYGAGLSEADTFPAQLERLLRKEGVRAEVINAGVPGYNLSQNIERIRKVEKDYRPGIVVLSFIYNDLENIEAGVEANMPPMESTLYIKKETLNKWGRLSQKMLPAGANVAAAPSARLRYSIARIWRTYLYVAMRLKQAGADRVPTGRRFTFPQTISMTSRLQIRGREEMAMKDFSAAARTGGFKPLLMIYMDYFVEGGPVLQLKGIARRHGIQVLDFSPYWGGINNYSKRFSLGWDPHPNAAADSIVAEGLLDCMSANGWVGVRMTPDRKKRLADYSKILARHNAAAVALGKKQIKEYTNLTHGFSSQLNSEEAARGGGIEDQWLYGWWQPGDFSWDIGGGRWMSGYSVFMLKAPEGGANKLVLEGYRMEAENPPPRQHLSVYCEGVPVMASAPVKPEKFKYVVRLHPALRRAGVIECDMFVSRLVSPATLRTDPKDNRLISLAFTKLALER